MSANEYLPSDSEISNGNGNGKPDNAYSSADEFSNAQAPKLRNIVRMDRGLSLGARLLFNHLSDRSFWASVSPGVGIVTMSKPKLGYELGTSSRTILRWQRELESKRYIWTRIFWRAGFELTNWYIRGMANPQLELPFTGADPTYGKTAPGRTRPRPVQSDSGQFCPQSPKDDSGDSGAKAGDHGQECPLTTDTSVRGPRTPVSADYGHQCPWTTDKNVPSQRTPVSVVNGHQCPQSTDTSVRSQRTPVSGLKETETVKESLEGTIKRLNDYGDTNRAKAAVPKKEKTAPGDPEGVRDLLRAAGANIPVRSASGNEKAAEREFLDECGQVLGPAEMKKNGGLWITFFRQSRRKAFAVIRETRAAQKERPDLLKKSWAAYAMDLWKNNRVGA